MEDIVPYFDSKEEVMTEAKQIERERIRDEGFPEPVSISEEVMNSLSREQREILSILQNLDKEGKRLVDKINAKRPTPSGILQIRGGITVCEDEDDWKVITMNSRWELKRVREQIKAKLNEALDHGLGFLDLIQRGCAIYDIKP